MLLWNSYGDSLAFIHNPATVLSFIPTAQMRVEAREGKQLVQGNRQVSAGAVMRLQSLSLLLLSARPTASGGEGGEGWEGWEGE